MGLITRFISDAKDLETVEYAILAGLIVAGVMATIATIGTWVKGVYESVQAGLGP